MMKELFFIFCILISGCSSSKNVTSFNNNINSNNYSLETINGVVKLVFTKDTLGYDKYWLVNKSIYDYYLIEDIIDELGIIDLTCGINDFTVRAGRRSLYDLSEYKDQILRDSAHTHFGGDLYYDTNNNIVLTFIVNAKVIIWPSPPCGEYVFQSSYSCPVTRDKITYPVCAIIDVFKAESLTESYYRKQGLIPYEFESFRVGICD